MPCDDRDCTRDMKLWIFFRIFVRTKQACDGFQRGRSQQSPSGTAGFRDGWLVVWVASPLSRGRKTIPSRQTLNAIRNPPYPFTIKVTSRKRRVNQLVLRIHQGTVPQASRNRWRPKGKRAR